MRRQFVRRALRPFLRAGDTRLQPNLAAASPRRILVCRPNHRLGNLLLLTPLLQELERRFPAAQVDIIAAGDAAPGLFAGFGNVAHVRTLARRMVRHLPATARIVWQARTARYDLAIDPCLASQTGRLLANVAGARHTLGFPRGAGIAEWTALDPVHRMPRHAAELPVYLLRRALGCDAGQLHAACPPLTLRLSQAERANAALVVGDLLHAGNDSPATPQLIGVFAEATGTKRFPRDWWRRLIAGLRAVRSDCVFMEILPPDGGARLAMGLPTYCSRNPREVAAVIARLTCFVSADCGVMHLASASGTPTIGLFSVSDAEKYQPYGHGGLGLVTTGKSTDEIAHLVAAHIDRLAHLACGNAPAAPP
ncbi:MAG TPA: glycosyltransferase family 9 protein [Rhodanobacteraceae bacterium]